jgi:hypothetical protein
MRLYFVFNLLWAAQATAWVAPLAVQRKSCYRKPVFLSTNPSDFSVEFSEDEIRTIENLSNTKDDMEKTLLETLPSLPPKLIVKLRQSVDHPSDNVRSVAMQLNAVLQKQMEIATVTLKGLLDAGEIRKLDSLIGKAARENRLDVAFFNVLSMNLQDAASTNGPSPGEGAASRSQILQHIYTRCQEEVEKSIPPGIALLNKILRTPEAQIRSNLYKHYLTPQPNVIKSPDGTEIQLVGVQPILLPLGEFIESLAKAVEQIRTIETAGGMDRESSANMVESCRTVAKEARIVIGESYGVESQELQQFQTGLEPVFRPTSAESPYIQGQTS